MPIYRLTWYFGQANTGWSETWYKFASRANGLKDGIEKLTDARMNLLTPLHNLLALRVSDVNSDRYSRLFLPGNQNQLERTGEFLRLEPRGFYTQNIENTGPDQIRAALQVECLLGSRRIALKYLAGIPDNLSLTEPNTAAPDQVPLWNTAFHAWTNVIWDQNFAIQLLDKTDEAPILPIIEWSLINNNVSELALKVKKHPKFNPVQSQKLAIQGVTMDYPSYKSPNGTWSVSKVESSPGSDEMLISLRKSAGYDPAFIDELGRVRLKIMKYEVPDIMAMYRVGIHKRGKPFGSPVGRSKTPRFVG